MKQLFLASTSFQVVCLAAAIDSGSFDVPASPCSVLDRTPRSDYAVDERVLIVSNHAQVLEFSDPIHLDPALAPAFKRFDRIVDLNAALEPVHPTAWKPADADLPLLEAALRNRWELGAAAIELVLESPHVNPAIALGRVFRRALLRIHADGLKSYGPTRTTIPLTNGHRVTSLHHLPLVDGLTPRLLSEFEVEPRLIAKEAFRAIIAEIADSQRTELAPLVEDLDSQSTGIALGQYLATLGLMSEADEQKVHTQMLTLASDRGLSTILFKLHPAAPPTSTNALRSRASELGLDLRIIHNRVPAEVLFSVISPALVLGSFSTALATARSIYGLPFAAVGTDKLLTSITPFENSNRIPLTIMDELGRARDISNTPAELQDLVDAVSYCMQPTILASFRSRAEALLSHAGPGTLRHFSARRLRELNLQSDSARSRPSVLSRRALRVASAAARVGLRQITRRRRG